MEPLNEHPMEPFKPHERSVAKRANVISGWLASVPARLWG